MDERYSNGWQSQNIVFIIQFITNGLTQRYKKYIKSQKASKVGMKIAIL